ncbi:helix-turn-helix transcriptional regulator [Paenibacillus sp. KACC 21273]|uniref:helix-turn-helix domain-containing protein n=1 Tax=Paenibacillus sp. KACC 21273 TaxID=3025665 RepID=UPI00236576ED|nr:helix-turn-helix transcriptional regulator [Paenibacillus sp. KACC 21273]WDF52459.1 helix-turn-helix transcriptional regulator [Paenibacillus sp. KACC 21273]
MKLKILLKRLLKEKGMTQLELSHLSSVPQSKISMLCNNNYQELNIANLEKIATAMEITNISELLEFIEEK